jgi:hypothetical protein
MLVAFALVGAAPDGKLLGEDGSTDDEEGGNWDDSENIEMLIVGETDVDSTEVMLKLII